jgi:flagellar biosynthesis chaperone FliJ
VRGAAAERVQLWNLAAQRVAVLEHVDEHRRTEHSHELRREEERVVDELVTAAYRRRNEDTPA